MAKLIERNNYPYYSKQTAALLRTLPDSYTVYTGAVRALMGGDLSEFLVVGPTGLFGIETAEDAGKYKGITNDRYLYFTAVDAKKPKQVASPLNAAVLNSGPLTGVLRKKGMPCTMQYAAYFPAATELDIRQTARLIIHPFSDDEALLRFIVENSDTLTDSDIAGIRAVVESL